MSNSYDSAIALTHEINSDVFNGILDKLTEVFQDDALLIIKSGPRFVIDAAATSIINDPEYSPSIVANVETRLTNLRPRIKGALSRKDQAKAAEIATVALPFGPPGRDGLYALLNNLNIQECHSVVDHITRHINDPQTKMVSHRAMKQHCATQAAQRFLLMTFLTTVQPTNMPKKPSSHQRLNAFAEASHKHNHDYNRPTHEKRHSNTRYTR